LILLPISLIFNTRTGEANSNALLDNFEEVNHLQYYVRFSPSKYDYFATKYGLDLEKYNEGGESYLKILLYYEDVRLTLFKDNYSYAISFSSREILETSNKNYNEYLLGTHSEIFLNSSEFKSSLKIRIDEPMTFSEYLKDYQDPKSRRSDITFYYVGIEQYNSNLLHNFTTRHYNTSQVLWTEGDF
jgi:hypothetical protein